MVDLVGMIQKNYAKVSGEIETARLRSPNAAPKVNLVVVTKGQPPEVITAAYTAGVRIFGENYPDETAKKLGSLGAMPNSEWHMIGHLQSRKAKIVAQYFQMMHSIDGFEIAQKLNIQFETVMKRLPILLEVNVGGEMSKFGFNAQTEESWRALLAIFQGIEALPNLEIRGLMTMPPIYENPEFSRPFFIQMRKLREYLQYNLPEINWSELSMGTSGDYRVAVEEGATYVRIGTAIVGPRPAR